MFEIRKDPTTRDLKLFGVALGAFFGVLGGLLRWKWGLETLGPALWIGAVVLLLFYYAVPVIRRPVYLGWSYATYPLGWLISRLVLAIVFYLLVTPIGLFLRLLGRDSMSRGFDKRTSSYWTEHRPKEDTESYFRQY